MLFSLAFLFLLLPCISLQTTAHEKKPQAEHSHHNPLVNHSRTKLNTSTANVNKKNPHSSVKAAHYFASANRSLSSTAKLSDANSQRTSKKEESPSSAQHPIKVWISNAWIQKDTTEHTANSTLVQAKELDLERGSPLVLTHQINLVPGACGGCEAEFVALRERLDRLEKEVSTLKDNCVGAEDGNECPNYCSDQGRCDGGRCVCFPGFNGHDCGTAVCPSECSNNGQCVNGQCMCDNGYSGLDCANQSCPGNCKNHGQCVQGKCVCHHGFMGTDCSTAPSGSVHLQSRDITDCSVTLFWTQPSVQYSSYHISFRSQREGDEIRANVGGRLTSFTQTELAAGQKYKVSIRGEKDGKMGPETTTELMTAPSGSVHLQSREITDSSVVLFWTQPSLQYDTYHITIKSQRAGDHTITAKVVGNFTSFTQTGLAADQNYKVLIRGERAGKMGPESTTEFITAPSGSVRLFSRDITDSSITLFWTQSSVLYSTYHITFTSLREGDKNITAKVGGRVFSFTQAGLSAGQKYTVSIRGERDGILGPERTIEFTTSPLGSIHLQSRDITDSSVTLFWAQPSVQYSTYNITFKNQSEADKLLTIKVSGRLTSFTQTGLVAGQRYKVSIRGERDGKMGPQSTIEFMTAPSGFVHLWSRDVTDSLGVDGSARSGSVHIWSRDVTDSSVTLFWTQPSVQYSTYHITFKSQKEGDEMITVKVGGRMTSFTQTGLAAGQKYKVSIRGERDGKMGPGSITEFTTVAIGSVDLHKRDITDSSVTLFWPQPSVQYSAFHITFKSQKDGDKMITAKVRARLTSFTQTGLVAGQKYKVSIRGEREGKLGPESTTEFTTAPSGSIHLQSRDITDSSVTLFWTQPSVQYSSYHITFKSQREGDKMIRAKLEGRLTSFTQTGLGAGQKYKVSIRGERDGKMGPESTTEFMTAQSGSVHLQRRDVTDSSVTLFWTQPSVQYSSYHITVKSQREGDKMIIAKVGERVFSFTQTGLTAGQKYKVSIRGERDGKMGPESTTEFTTAASGSVHLQSRDVTDSSVTLFWTQPSVQYSTYHITFKSQKEGDKMLTKKIGGRLYSFTQTGLAAGRKYMVSIRGEKDGKMGPESTTEFMTAPSGSIYFQTKDTTHSSVTLFWTQPSVQYSTYHITFKSQSGVKTIQTKVGGKLTSFTQTGLAAGQKYKVSIRGERDGKMGPESTTEFMTAPSGSVRLQNRAITDSSVTLFWTQPSVQYSTYHITIKSQTEGNKIITAKVGERVFSFTQTGLAAGQKYKVSIRGEKDGKMGPESTTEFMTAPTGSIHLQSRDITDSTVTLFWPQPSVQYSTYHITFKSQREGDKIIQAKMGGRLNSFTQTGLAARQKYKVSIRGERDGKMGPESTTEFMTAPSGSVHLWTRDINESSVTLFWTQPLVQYGFYHITFKSQREGDKMITAKVGGRGFSFTQTGLAAGLKYKVSIRGERDGKMGPESTTEFMTAPSGSVYLRSRDVTDSSVTLLWTQPSVQYSSYHIAFKSQREGDEMIMAKIGGRISSFTQTRLASGQKYKVSIRGVKHGKMGPESTTEFTTAPSGTIHLQSRDITDSSVTLFWTQSSVQYSTYHITFKSQGDGDKIIETTVGGRLSSFTQTRLVAGQKYEVSIRGERDGKMGPVSTTEFMTAPPGSIHLQSRDITDSTVTLFWPQPSVQYSTYHITFKSQRQGDKILTAKGSGRISSFTQKGLAAGQRYKVSVRGERDGKMGPESTTEFMTAPSGFIHLQSRDITDSTVTLFWVQPSVQYSTYHITFKSLKDRDETIAAKVGGRLTSFTQTGLAAGLTYKVSIRGEKDGKMGPESTTEFTTGMVVLPLKERIIIQRNSTGSDISGPRNLHILKTTPTSVLVQWESPMGDIDSYRLSILPSFTKTNDRKKEGQETTLPPDTDAANIDGLEEGRLYNITLIAQKGRSHSQPIRVQAVPGTGKKIFNKVIVETVTAKQQPEGDIIAEKKTSDKTTLDKTLFFKKNEEWRKKEKSSRTREDGSETKQSTHMTTDDRNSLMIEKVRSAGGGTGVTAQEGRRITSQTLLKQDATRGQGVTRPESRLYSKHHSKVLSNSDLKTPGTKSIKTVEGQRKTHDTVMENTSRLLMHSSSVKVNNKRPAPKVELTKSDRTSGHKTSELEGDVTTAGDSKATGLRKSGVTQKKGTESFHRSLGYSSYSSWNVTGTLKTASTTDSVPVVVEKTAVIKTGGQTKANNTVSVTDKENNAKQVTQTGNVTKTEGLGTVGTSMITLKNDTSTIRKGNQGVQSTFYRNHTSSSEARHIHGKIGHNDTSSQTSVSAAIRPSTRHKNTSKADISQTDITSSRTRNMGSVLNNVEVQNITSRGFAIIWEAPRGMFQNFMVTRSEYVLRSGKEMEVEEEGTEEEEEEDEEEEREERSKVRVSVSETGWDTGDNAQSITQRNTTNSHRKSGAGSSTHQFSTKSRNTTSVRVDGKNMKKVSQVIPGNARSLTFRNLQPHTRYSLTLFGMSSGLQSKIHHFTITTGPESPSELLFSNVTDSSLSVSWTKPKGPITGFKITYTHPEDGQPTSISVDAKHSSVTLSQLSPGSSYEVSVVSVLGLKESDPVKGLVITVPDPPKGLRAVNITDTEALLVWKPARASVDQYIIIFGSEKAPDMTVKVSGNYAEHKLNSLLSGTVYTVTVTSQLDSQQSSGTTTTFTTAGGSGIRRGEVPQEMPVHQVTPRSAVLSWKSPNMAVTSYRLIYQSAGQEPKEVTLASSINKFKLTGLIPLSKYMVRVQGERKGQYITIISTEFKTGSLRFPFPTDCSQELLNGMQQSGEVEVFPAGREGRPVRVYCDMETDGGGWTVFQRRMTGEINFFRGWSDYSYGFGNLSAEFWLGNENIHNLTILRPMALRVDLHVGAESAFACYSFFYIDSQRKHYALRVSGYSGTAGDSMGYYNGRPFSTHDKDPFPISTHCDTSYRGGWWHKNCHKANINGLYNTGTTDQGVIWTDRKGRDFSTPFTEMKLRPASFSSRTHR